MMSGAMAPGSPRRSVGQGDLPSNKNPVLGHEPHGHRLRAGGHCAYSRLKRDQVIPP